MSTMIQLKRQVYSLRAALHSVRIERVHDIGQLAEANIEIERLKTELKFAEDRLVCLAEAIAETRMGYQKEIEILKKGHTNPKRDQGTNKADNKGKPSRPGVDGKIVRHKPSKGRGTY